MNTPGFFPLVEKRGKSLKRRLDHVLSGVRIVPKVGRRWIAAAILVAVAAIAGVGFAQQGKPAPAQAPEPAANVEVAKESKPTPPQKPQTSAAHTPTPEKPVAAPLPPGVVALRGRVLLPNGQPAVGAIVQAMKSVFQPRGWGQPAASTVVLATWTADTQGTFAGDVNAGVLKHQEVTLDLWATLPGFGLAFHPIVSGDKPDDIVMKLASEEPIRGRVIDLEGGPVRDARVDVLKYFDATTATIDQSLSLAKSTGVPGNYEDLGPTAWMSDSLSPTAKTSVDGHFELRGVGHDRAVYLRVSGPHVATDILFVLTRSMPPIRSRFGGLFGSQFERAVGPGAPADGFITDSESGRPVAGVRLEPISWDYPAATTDERGHYRFEGISPAHGLICDLRVPEDLPYFSAIQFLRIPPSRSLGPVRQDLKLIRGIWAVGRAYNRVTGKPVSGALYYTPFLSNKRAQEVAVAHPMLWLGLMQCGRADAEGRVRALVLPGRGVLSLQCDSGDYRFDFGRTQIKEFADPKLELASVTFASLGLQSFHTIREVNVASDAREAHVDVPVDPGQNITLKFVDPDGKHLAGVETSGLRFPDLRFLPGRGKFFADGDSAILYATYPGETRTIWFRHRSSGFARLLNFTPKPGETERTIVLEPPAVVTGRMLNPDGAPLSGIKIQCDLGEGWEIVTDAQGHFRRDLPPGGPFSLYVSSGAFPRLTVASGEQIDFGDITIDHSKPPTKVQTGAIKRTKARTANSTPPASASIDPKPQPGATNQIAPAIRELRGRGLLPNGQPAVGAKVRAIKSRFRGDPQRTIDFDVVATFAVDSKGEFAGNVTSAPLDQRETLNLWATLPGYGAALQPLVPDEKSGAIVLNLAEDEPIRGHLITLEGQPVRDALVEVIDFSDSTSQWIDEWIVASKDRPLLIRSVLPNRPAQNYQSRDGEVVMRVKAVSRVSNVLFPSVTTNADGRFELKGIGRDRHVYLRISAPRTATIVASVVTRPIEPIPYRFYDVLGSQFERVALPSVPVEGFVTDADSGKPIAGAVIRTYAVRRGSSILQTLQHVYMDASAISDANGHYHLEGLESQSPNLYRARVPDQPYLGTSDTFPAAASLKAVRHDIKLKRGVWVVGRAYDRTTGKPVSGSLSYTPFRSNEFVRKSTPDRPDSFRDYHFFPGAVDPEGHFRICVIPGRGVLCLQCESGDYRVDFGREQIKGLADRKSENFDTSPTLTPLPWGAYHSLREINPAAGDQEAHVDLPVDPGQNVVLKFTDASGKRLSGIESYGSHSRSGPLRAPPDFSDGESVTVFAAAPEETRTVWLRHRSSGLTKLLAFVPTAGETERTVVLETPAVVTGRLRSEEGEPLSGLTVECHLFINLFPRVPGTVSDAQGNFHLELAPGGPFVLQTVAPHADLSTRLTVAAGERIDLGEITIERDKKENMRAKVRRGPVKRTTPHVDVKKAAASAPPDASGPENAGPWTKIRGKVLRPDGKPAVDATVACYGWRDSRRWERHASTRSDARGEFELTRPQAEEVGFIVVTAEGLGFASRRLADDQSQPLALQLVADEPIRGRVLDLEGRPVSGARVHVTLITDSLNRSLDAWLAAMKSGAPRYNAAAHALLGPILSVAAANNSWESTIPGASDSRTDADGRFTLRGLGAKRVIDLAITSDTTAYRRVTVVTQKMSPIIRSISSGAGGLELYGAEFTTNVKPTRPVVGTVRDIKTGKPLEGVTIESWRLADDFFTPTRGVRTTSDAQGRYRLVGQPKGQGNVIRVVPGDDQPYFMRRIDVSDASGIEPVTLDIELSRGVWITGRVIDKESGKPVRGHVNYWPFLDNPFAKGRPEFGPGREMVTDQYRWPMHPDGTFRIPGLPGRGVVGAETDLSYRQGAGAAEIHDADRDGELRTYRDRRGPSLKYPAAMKEINPSEGTESVVCDLVCDHGETVKVTVLDPQGKPARHCSLSQQPKNGKINDVDSPFELNGLSLNVADSLLVEQKERKLAKVVTFTLTEGSPRSLTVKLEPYATVIGRLLDEDGLPIKGVTIEPQLRGGGAYWVEFPSAVCQENGRFECRGLSAGASFSFLIHGTATNFLQGFGFVAAEAGKTIDVGDIHIQRRGIPKTDFIKLQKPPMTKAHAAGEAEPKVTAASTTNKAAVIPGKAQR